MSPDLSHKLHKKQIESHLEGLHSLFKMQRGDNPTIRSINEKIREQKYNVQQDHDRFDPNGSVKWGEEGTSGFLTKMNDICLREQQELETR